ncbi:hypothetical protein [Arcicella rigui]|uniref:Uncharacterized protein n=1 Tax=Arcicella rigui TaxID=797020 RepID=A0ABU5QFC0_9BACT|nr:hypothetical protein [Arcicella rigui]MEA5141237.1 hypothetical protein [Arcicella rigui]
MINKEIKRELYSLGKIIGGFIIVVMLLILFSVLFKSPEKPFAEFYITDFSKPITFIDSSSASHSDVHDVILIKITGVLDSNASITYGSNRKKYLKVKPTEMMDDGGGYELTKGKINIDDRHDYYQGDTIRILFTPKGCKKGWLRIKTKIY